MKKHVFKFIAIICMTSCFLSTWDVRLHLINKSEHKVRYIWEIKNILDTIPDIKFCETDELNTIESNYEQVIRTQRKWEFTLRDHPDKILRIFIINEDSLSKHGACEIYKQQIFMKRFDLTYKDFERLNWKVVYEEKP